MTVLYDNGNKPYKHPVPYDRNSKVIYARSYRPDKWLPDYEYREGDGVKKWADIVIPDVPNGFMYECVSAGNSGAVEPQFVPRKSKFTIDNTIKWKALPYALALNVGDAIVESTWVGANGEKIESSVIVEGILTKFKLVGVQPDASTAEITNHFKVIRNNGDVEEFDRTLIITIREL